MSKLKLFLSNFLVYGLGGVISKIIPLIMVPIVARLMPNSEYFGLSDMSNTVVSFCSAIAVLGMYDAMFRMFFEKEDVEYRKGVCSTTFIFTLFTSFLVFLVMLLFRRNIAAFFFENTKYAYLVYLTAAATFVGATNSIISAPTRIQNKRKIFLITNTIAPIISYAISIPLLLKGYYVMALPLAACISAVILEICFGVLNRQWFSRKSFDLKLLPDLLYIAVPLFPNFLVYWIFNSSDRVMITRLIGIGESGIYAVGSKLGLASQLIYTAFAGGWQYFAFSTMNEDNQVENNSRVFEYLGCISYVSTIGICVIARPLYSLLFGEKYHNSYIVSPYLFLAPLLLMLFQVACNQFIVVRKTWPNMIILSFGAVANVCLNFVLIPRIGIEGAAISTLAGYTISVIICVLVLIKMELMVISKKFILSSGYMVIAFLIWRIFGYNNIIVSLFVAIIMTMMLCATYIKDITRFVNILFNKKGNRK